MQADCVLRGVSVLKLNPLDESSQKEPYNRDILN